MSKAVSGFAVGSRRGASVARALALSGLLVLWAFGVACSSGGRPAVRPGHSSWVAVASWYGAQYHGRRTASGEVFDMNGRTAAHRTLPFGTRLKITHMKNHRSIVVKINDRGPFIRGREIDLSYGAASALGMVNEGLAKVRIERLN